VARSYSESFVTLKEAPMITRRGSAVLAVMCVLWPFALVRADDAEDKAVEAIKKLGGKVMRDENAEGRPVILVDLRGTNTTDAALMELKQLKKLQTLDLFNTKITDEGLKELKELKSLRILYVNKTKVTDAAVLELKKALPDLKVDR
jgi:hypothetical protein